MLILQEESGMSECMALQIVKWSEKCSTIIKLVWGLTS